MSSSNYPGQPPAYLGYLAAQGICDTPFTTQTEKLDEPPTPALYQVSFQSYQASVVRRPEGPEILVKQRDNSVTRQDLDTDLEEKLSTTSGSTPWGLLTEEDKADLFGPRSCKDHGSIQDTMGTHDSVDQRARKVETNDLKVRNGHGRREDGHNMLRSEMLQRRYVDRKTNIQQEKALVSERKCKK